MNAYTRLPSRAVLADSERRASEIPQGKFGAWHCDSCDAPRNYERMYCARCEAVTGSYTFGAEEAEPDAIGDLADYLYDLRRDDALMERGL